MFLDKCHHLCHHLSEDASISQLAWDCTVCHHIHRRGRLLLFYVYIESDDNGIIPL